MKTVGCYAAVMASVLVYLYIFMPRPPDAAAQSETSWRSLASTIFREVAYDPATKELRIRFASGHQYLYRQVPQDCYREFVQSDMKGVYFNRCIRRCYASERVDPPQPQVQKPAAAAPKCSLP
jgi:hypothetical protein